MILGWALLIAIARLVGFVNWLPTLAKVPPFLTTLATYTALQGLSLLFRKTVGGEINVDVLNSLLKKIDWFPWVAVVAIALGFVLEYTLRRTAWGVKLRAVGSDPEHAHAVGIRVARVQPPYLVGGLLVFLASLVLMTQVGAGDPTAASPTRSPASPRWCSAGPASSAAAAPSSARSLGAALIQQINASVSFLGVNTAWQTYMLGILT